MVVKENVSITLVGVYLAASIGLNVDNLHKLSHLGAFLRSILGPWIAVGDWNLSPEILRASQWLHKVSEEITLPENTNFTAAAAVGSMLD